MFPIHINIFLDPHILVGIIIHTLQFLVMFSFSVMFFLVFMPLFASVLVVFWLFVVSLVFGRTVFVVPAHCDNFVSSSSEVFSVPTITDGQLLAVLREFTRRLTCHRHVVKVTLLYITSLIELQ